MSLISGAGSAAWPFRSRSISIRKRGTIRASDPASPGIQWCTRNIRSAYENFRFMHSISRMISTIQRHLPGTGDRASLRRRVFDFAIMTSVVTHLPAKEIEPYFREIARLLAPGDGCSCRRLSWNLKASVTPKTYAADPVQRHGEGPAWYADAQAPLAAVAFDDGFLDTCLQTTGFDIALKKLGHWRGQTGSRHYQDFFVAVKSARGRAE